MQLIIKSVMRDFERTVYMRKLKKEKNIKDSFFTGVKKPSDWPANAIECELENIYNQTVRFMEEPNYKNKEVLISLLAHHDLNQSSMLGIVRTTAYEVACINTLYMQAGLMCFSLLKTYLYELVGYKTRLQKMISWFPGAQSLEIKEFDYLLPSLALYHITYKIFTVEKEKSFAEQLIGVVEENIRLLKENNSEKEYKDGVANITNFYITLLNDISYFRCALRTRIWTFTHEEILRLFRYVAELIKINGESPLVRPLKGVLMTSISNYILKSRNDYNEDYIYKYISKEVALKSIYNHEIWMSVIEKLNDSREQRVIPELFEESNWNKINWAKDIDFEPLRKYYVSSFCKSANDKQMMKDYGSCIYGYKDDRMADVLSPIILRHWNDEIIPVFTQIIAFDVLYDKEEAKKEIEFLCSLIDCFDATDKDKKQFLEEILQYWILSVKDPSWSHEQERRYVLFMYNDYHYNEIDVSDERFLKLKTSLFIEPDFILGDNPVKDYLKKLVDEKRNAISTKPYLFCLNCFNRDFDVVAGSVKATHCPICNSKKIRIEYPKNRKRVKEK